MFYNFYKPIITTAHRILLEPHNDLSALGI